MNLRETGVLDKETTEIMAKPRCGVADTKRSNRNKRFSVKNGPKWNKTHLTWR